jgi:excinuclease ABC subunit C
MKISSQIEHKLANLPKSPGVYFHKNSEGKIIYIGKAAVLRNRVRQYFQTSRTRDPKTEALISEIADIDWMVVDSELEALFLESELVRRYLPQYNILLRDDKSLTYIRIDYNSDYPTVGTTRRPLDDGAKYFGPYFSAMSVKQALKLLRHAFPYATRRIIGQKRATLHYHLGLDPGLEDGRTSLEDYRANLRRLIAVIEGKRQMITKELEKKMNKYSKASEFEEAAKVRNQLFTLRSLNNKVVFSDKEFLDISKDHALNEIVNLLSMSKFPARIEGYDISHMQGTDVVASMVVFTNGASNKNEYRKFKTRIDHNNDFFNMNETIKRRFSEKNVKAWGIPGLVVIDGGKGQLDAAIQARDEKGFERIPFIGLAKREEQIVLKKAVNSSQSSVVSHGTEDKHQTPDNMVGGSGLELNVEFLHQLSGFSTESEDFILINLPHSTNLIKLLQRIRDESHRFAVSYHSVLKQHRQIKSLLDEIPGVGPATRKKLLKTFGSVRNLSFANEQKIAEVVGQKKAEIIKKYLLPNDVTPASPLNK